MDDKYMVLYKGYNGGYILSSVMSLELARIYRDKCKDMGYKDVKIIYVIE